MRHVLAILACLAASPAAAFDESATGWLSDVAIDGFDATAYWKGGPEEGRDAHEVSWKGAIWRFAAAEDAAAFEAAPERFAPAYGGRCANAMSMGKDVAADAEIWLIEEDRLFLFYAEDGRTRWREGDRTALIAEADAQWAALSGG